MRRPTLILAGLALALVAAVQPAAAFTELGSGGTYYVPQVTDEQAVPGAFCRYADKAGSGNDTLRWLKVRSFFTHAPYTNKAYVGYRVTILRNGSPYYTTPMIKKKANQSEVAFFGPTTWNRPAGLGGTFQAVIKLTFYTPNGVKKGHYRGIIDVYSQRLGKAPAAFAIGDPGDPGDYQDANAPGACHKVFPTPM